MNVNIPKRRFKGFVEPWEQRKLGEHLEKVRSYPISRSQETQNITNTKYIHYGDIHVNIAEYINQNTKLPYIIENEKYESLKIGDLIFADASEDKDGIAKASFISKDKYDFNIVGGTHTIATRPNQSIVQSEFIYFFSKTNRFRKYAMKMATGTKIYGITYSNLAKMAIASPLNTEEQKKIIKMISNIEALVTLHKRKFEKLKQLQKSYLNESIFSESKCVPKRRFKGFIDEWEQCKLKDILKVNSGRDYKHLAKGDIPVYGTGGLIARVDDFLSNQPAVGLGRKGTINNPFFLEPPFWTVDTLFYLTSEKDNHINFIFYLLLRIRWKKYDESTGVPSLSKKTIENINVFSTKFEEQIKIAKILEKINDLINLHKHKHNAIKKLQKIYLQNNLKDETYA